MCWSLHSDQFRRHGSQPTAWQHIVSVSDITTCCDSHQYMVGELVYMYLCSVNPSANMTCMHVYIIV